MVPCRRHEELAPWPPARPATFISTTIALPSFVILGTARCSRCRAGCCPRSPPSRPARSSPRREAMSPPSLDWTTSASPSAAGDSLKGCASRPLPRRSPLSHHTRMPATLTVGAEAAWRGVAGFFGRRGGGGGRGQAANGHRQAMRFIFEPPWRDGTRLQEMRGAARPFCSGRCCVLKLVNLEKESASILSAPSASRPRAAPFRFRDARPASACAHARSPAPQVRLRAGPSRLEAPGHHQPRVLGEAGCCVLEQRGHRVGAQPQRYSRSNPAGVSRFATTMALCVGIDGAAAHRQRGERRAQRGRARRPAREPGSTVSRNGAAARPATA